MRVSPMEVANKLRGVLDVRSGFPGVVFRCILIPGPFDEVLEPIAAFTTIEDCGNLELEFVFDFNGRRRSLVSVRDDIR